MGDKILKTSQDSTWILVFLVIGQQLSCLQAFKASPLWNKSTGLRTFICTRPYFWALKFYPWNMKPDANWPLALNWVKTIRNSTVTFPVTIWIAEWSIFKCQHNTHAHMRVSPTPRNTQEHQWEPGQCHGRCRMGFVKRRGIRLLPIQWVCLLILQQVQNSFSNTVKTPLLL